MTITGYDGTEIRGSLRWWRAPEDELAEAVFRAAYAVDDATLARQQRVVDAYTLYGDTSDWPQGGSVYPSDVGQLSKNVIAGTVDTFVAELCQGQPRAMFSTAGGTWGDGYRARRLTLAHDAWIDWADVRALSPMIVRDGAIAGLGAALVRPDEDRGETTIERIFPLHLLVDDVSAIDIEPRAIYLRRVLDKHHLAELYPEQSEQIVAQAGAPPAYTWAFALTADAVEVLEAWHLETRPTEDDDETDGRHVVCCRGVVLLDEPWRRGFPIATFRPLPPVRGWWGESMVWRAAPEQLELNKLAARIQEAMHYMSVPRAFVQPGAMQRAHMSNDIGIIIETTSPPTFMTPPAMNPDVYARESALEDGCYRRFGISQMSATSEKPAGLTSGKALRTHREAQSRRFAVPLRAYERWHVQVAHLWAASEQDIAETTTSHAVLYEQYGALQRIPWSQIRLGTDRARIRVQSASGLPTEPAARIEVLQEMVADGVMGVEDFYASLDMPDFEGRRDELVAPAERIREQLDRMLETGEYRAPEPYMDLARGLGIAARMVQRAELAGAPEEHCEAVRQWMSDAQALIERAAPPAPPGMPPGLPPGMPPEAMGQPGAPIPQLPAEMIPAPPEGMPPEVVPPTGV
uniref:Portal protein n=1 Tax=viral metagenome TaxID=1070528 RepID=A0A6M3K3T0_9ZZZZ